MRRRKYLLRLDAAERAFFYDGTSVRKAPGYNCRAQRKQFIPRADEQLHQRSAVRLNVVPPRRPWIISEAFVYPSPVERGGDRRDGV